MDDSDTARTLFSTEGLFVDLPPAKAARAWRDFCAEHFGQVDVEVRDDVRFHGLIEGINLDACVSVGRVALNAKRIARTPAAIKADCDDRLILIINTTGEPCSIKQRGRDLTVVQGRATLFSHGHPDEFRDLPAGPCIQIIMDRNALASRVTNPEDFLAMDARGNSDALRLLTAYSNILFENEPDMRSGLAGTTASHLMDLAALVLGTSRDSAVHAQANGVRAARLAAIKADILGNLARPDLSITAVAAHHGVTPRYVRMLFEPDGTSFSEFVLEQRLVRAYRLLTDPRLAARAVGAIALDVGFGDLSYFNRTFRRRFGATPSDVRQKTRLFGLHGP